MIPGTIRGQIEFLKLQERTTYNTFDYLQFVDARTLTQDTTNNIGASASGRINQKWRRVISQWVYDVIDHLNCPREVAAVCMNVVDRCVCRYVQDAKTFSRWEYRLLALTGLFLAVNANAPDTLTVEDAVRLGNNGFDKEQIQGKEKEILQMLGNALHPPTPQKFLKLYFLALLGHNCNRYSKHVFQKANYLIELSIMEHFAVIYKPSQVALAATLNAFEDEDIALAPDKISLLQEIGVVEGLDSCQDYLRRL